MKKILCPHDKAFKSAMKDIKVAKEFFENYLPASVRDKVDLNTLKIKDTTYIDPNLNELRSDLLFEAMIHNKPGFLYTLIEQQSTAVTLMPFRLLQYEVLIWADYIKSQKKSPETLPLIIPIVFYNGTKPYDKPKNMHEIIDADQKLIEDFLFKDFVLIDTNLITDESLRKQTWSGILTHAFKHARGREYNRFSEFFSMAQHLITAHGESASVFIETLLLYQYHVASMNKQEELQKFIKQPLIVPGGKDIMTTVAEYLRAEGCVQGKSSMLLNQLKHKFGPIPEFYRNKVLRADEFQIGTWSVRILTASTIDEIFEVQVIA